MLVNIQKPGSVYVASADQWEHDFQRTIKPEARPLVILQPCGPIRFVFELLDTEGKPFPEKLGQPFKTKGDLSPVVMNHLLSSLPRSGIAYREVDQGSHSAGSIGPAPKGAWQELPVARQICERFGIENRSEKYLSEYQTENKEIPNISLEAVLKAANTIETMLQGRFQARKELLWAISERNA